MGDRSMGTACARDFVRVFVDDQVSDAQEGVILLGAHRAAQDGADARDDLFEAEGFGDVVVAADGQALDLVAHVVARGEKEDGVVMPASRRRRVTVKPSMSGSMTSRTIRSGREAWAS